MFTLDCDRAYLYAHPERELTAEDLARCDEALARRATGVPAQYITGHQEFWGLDFIVSPAVLIPRPETEHVVEAVLELAKLAQPDGRSRPSPHGLRIVDVGTGSGAIALALAKELPSAEIHATDISPEALDIARANAARHELTIANRVSRDGLARRTADGVIRLSWFRILPTWASRKKIRCSSKCASSSRGMRCLRGRRAMEVIERMIPQARAALAPGGWLVFEISGTIADRVRSLLLSWDEVEIRNDLQGIARVAMARKATSG